MQPSIYKHKTPVGNEMAVIITVAHGDLSLTG